MAKILSNRTAAALQRLLQQSAGGGSRPGAGPVDLDGPSRAGVDTAWAQQPVTGGVLVTHGPVLWGAILVDPDWATYTYHGGDPQLVSHPAVTGNRWLYVSANFNAMVPAGVSGSVTAAFTDDNIMPKDAWPILKRPLSLWSFATADGVTTAEVVYVIPSDPFPRNLATILAPPRI